MQNSRLNTRSSFFSEVNVLRMGERSSRRVWGKNISENGIYLQTTHSYAKGERLSLRFKIGPKEVLVRAAEVVWTKKFEPVSIDGVLPGVGLRFLAVDPPSRMAIRGFVHEGLLADASNPVEFSKPSLPPRCAQPQMTDKLPEPQNIAPLPRDEGMYLSLDPTSQLRHSQFPIPSPASLPEDFEATRPQLPRSAQLSETKPYPIHAKTLAPTFASMPPAKTQTSANDFEGWTFVVHQSAPDSLSDTDACMNAFENANDALERTIDESLLGKNPTVSMRQRFDNDHDVEGEYDETLKNERNPPKNENRREANLGLAQRAQLSDPLKNENRRGAQSLIGPACEAKPVDPQSLIETKINLTEKEPSHSEVPVPPAILDSTLEDELSYEAFSDPLSAAQDICERPTMPPQHTLDTSMSDIFFSGENGLRSLRETLPPKSQFDVPDFMGEESPPSVIKALKKKRAPEDSFIAQRDAALGTKRGLRFLGHAAIGACLFFGAASLAYFGTGDESPTQNAKTIVTLDKETKVVDVAEIERELLGTNQNVETKAIETKAVETKAVEPKTIETKAVETKTVEIKAVETKAVETKAVETKAIETKVVEVKKPKSPEQVIAEFTNTSAIADKPKKKEPLLANVITTPKVPKAPSKNTLSIDFPQGDIVKVFGLKNPSRVVIDLENAKLPQKQSYAVNKAGITRVRMGRPQPNTRRVVIELEQDAAPRGIKATISNQKISVSWR